MNVVKKSLLSLENNMIENDPMELADPMKPMKLADQIEPPADQIKSLDDQMKSDDNIQANIEQNDTI